MSLHKELLEELVTDPRPDLPDSLFFKKLFVSIFDKNNPKETYALHLVLWQMRLNGMVINRNRNKVKLVPLIYPNGGYWESAENFDDVKRTYLLPFSMEVKNILALVAESVR